MHTAVVVVVGANYGNERSAHDFIKSVPRCEAKHVRWIPHETALKRRVCVWVSPSLWLLKLARLRVPCLHAHLGWKPFGLFVIVRSTSVRSLRDTRRMRSFSDRYGTAKRHQPYMTTYIHAVHVYEFCPQCVHSTVCLCVLH